MWRCWGWWWKCNRCTPLSCFFLHLISFVAKQKAYIFSCKIFTTAIFFFLDYLIWFAHFELKCVIIFLKHSPALLTFPQQDVFLFQQLCFCLIDKCNTCTHSLTELHHCVETDWKRQILCECVSTKREVCKNSAVVSSPVIPTLFILFVKTYLKGLMRKFDSIS